MKKIFKWRPWMRIPAIVLGILCLFIAIWFGFPMIPLAIFQTIWLRAVVLGVIISIILIVQFFKWRKRRKLAAEMEAELIAPEPEGDGKVLSEKMSGALAKLKKSGGATYLYDLPWYVIIGPPGAGKTTALRNSGIEFPVSGDDGDDGGMEGFGGTRYCDWWFAEDAIMIDTAGRYTTQDSNSSADSASWTSFLELLKKSRPNQPINGVMLAFSAEDMMTMNDQELSDHAETVRARLGELHEHLRVDFPVYVLFTKSDLISGFREYFSSFNVNRRKNVWGVTFQTKDRKENTFEQVKPEFDKLVSRLSDELIDRLSEEPDGISRVAIFGLPGQMALMRDNVSEFLRRVFAPSKHNTNAILRGFYFTSGTQEGTPIDQVLGAMSQTADASAGMAPAFMSGQGKSFFIHDLLKKVIFEERDWVSHDMGAVRRTAVLRAVSLGAIGVATAAMLAVFGISFWNNRNLVNVAETEAATYSRAAQVEIARTEVDDSALEPILPYLESLRLMPAGYGETAEPTIWEGFGLGQRDRLSAATENAYADALEQMFRPRLILDLETRLAELRNTEEPAEIYRALKVYLLLGETEDQSDDDAIKTFFDDLWFDQFTGLNGLDTRETLASHLDAMLTLDGRRDVGVKLDETTITNARSAIVQMSLADQAYALIKDRSKAAGLLDFQLENALGVQGSLVFETVDGSDLSTVTIEGLYTYEGFWSFFFEQLTEVGDALEADKWVLGDQASLVNFDSQMAGLDQALQTMYRRDFESAWLAMFDEIRLANMSADAPLYDTLAVAAAPFASPILQLVKAVDNETKLTRELDALAAQLAGGEGGSVAENAADDVGAFVARDTLRRGPRTLRILTDSVRNSNKDQTRVNGSSGGDSPTRSVERLTQVFESWHILLEGPEGQRPIDIVLADLEAIRGNLRLAASNPAQSAALLPQLLSNLTRNNSRLPQALRKIVNDAESDFRSEATDATLAEMNRALNNTITQVCRATITDFFPFSNSQRQVPTADFGRFFGPGGDMDVYYNTYLAPHVLATGDGLAVDPNSPLADRLSTSAIRQFDRAIKIRRAFFGAGGTNPEVQITISHEASHPTIEQAHLEINGVNTITAAGDPPKTVTWPGAGASTTLQVFPTLDRNSTMEFRGGQWTFVNFMRSAASTQRTGNTVRATFNVGGRSISYDIGFNTASNPFTMPELSEFSCPQSLD
ncbi:MAG: type VI secretion system membrane subunit TssM [Yoonia sp.]|uniref:type VI secretion system membrane subunit TssM n=1 Tax=Yoonia sp. TaxID=2212373 RepID=UPI00329888D1